MKDEDNAAWVMELPKAERRQWVKRIRWIRLVDRLAEKEQGPLLAMAGNAGATPAGEASSQGFVRFCNAWQQLQQSSGSTATIDASWDTPLEAPLDEILEAIAQEWFHPTQTAVDHLSICSWDRYLAAIDRYHCHHVHIQTLDDYEAMLDGLAGSFFQILPFLEPHHWECARYFGIVDQFYNNLRDIYEDAQRGICYFPAETLTAFGVSRESILDGSCIGTENYRRMMEFWMEEYLLQLRRRAHGLLLCPDLHPSWVRLRAWCLHRYERIELVLRQCEFDFRLFARCYWQVVRSDLEHYHRLSLGPTEDESYQLSTPQPALSPHSLVPSIALQVTEVPTTTVPGGIPNLSAPFALTPGSMPNQGVVTWRLAIAQFLKVSPVAVSLSQRIFVPLSQAPPAHRSSLTSPCSLPRIERPQTPDRGLQEIPEPLGVASGHTLPSQTVHPQWVNLKTKYSRWFEGLKAKWGDRWGWRWFNRAERKSSGPEAAALMP